jgi:predicted ribosomally synthesized peptide with SipW-like signal peptide
MSAVAGAVALALAMGTSAAFAQDDQATERGFEGSIENTPC